MQSVFSPRVHGIPPRTDKFTGIGIAIAMHVAVILILLQYAPARTALINVAPLMVSLITSPAPKPDALLPKPPPVKRVTPQPRVAPPVMAAAPDASSTVRVPPSPPAPPAPVESDPAPVAPPFPSAAPVAAEKPAPAAPLTPPNFNAHYLNNPAPPYPTLARRQRQQGKVTLRVFVNNTGGADQVQIRTGSGYDLLDQAALDAVRRWRFVPARQGDQPVAAWVLVPITFSLEG